MFKIGDKVVCAYETGELELNKVYVIKNIFFSHLTLFDMLWAYEGIYFISMKEYRKQKLKELEKYDNT